MFLVMFYIQLNKFWECLTYFYWVIVHSEEFTLWSQFKCVNSTLADQYFYNKLVYLCVLNGLNIRFAYLLFIQRFNKNCVLYLLWFFKTTVESSFNLNKNPLCAPIIQNNLRFIWLPRSVRPSKKHWIQSTPTVC